MGISIDLVYTWVDGNDPEHQALRRRYSQNPEDLNPERFRDDHELLRYSLRSIERFAPWIANIHLVTQRPQVPSWLRRDHPRIRLVHHDQIFDRPEDLPVFNSHPIEAHLHRIPTSSDYFLYLNDDALLLRPTSPQDFVTQDGRVLVWGAMAHANLWDRLLNLRIDLGWIEHSPVLIHKGHYEAALQSLGPQLRQEVCQARFRAHHPMILWRAYRRYLLSLPPSQRQLVPAHQVVKWHRLLRLSNRLEEQQKEQRLAFAMQPGILFVNDDQGESPNPEVGKLLRAHLQAHLPTPSRFEQPSQGRILLVHPSFQPPGGGNGVAAWMLQALQQKYSVTVLCWAPPRWAAVDAYFGTQLAQAPVSTLTIPWLWRKLVAPIPSWIGSLALSALLLRRAKQLAAGSDYDLVIGSHCESDFGRAGLQYVHFPRTHHPWHHVDPIWYRLPPLRAIVHALDRLSHAVAGFSKTGMLLNRTLVNSRWTGRLFHKLHGRQPQVLYPPAAGDFPATSWQEREDGLVCISRFAEDKRLLMVFDIVQQLRQRGHRLPLHLVGSPDSPALTQHLRRLAQLHSDWFFLHQDLPREQLTRLVSRYRYGIHGMAEEHFGMAVAEMVRAGSIVFVPRGGGQVEIVGDDDTLTYTTPQQAVDNLEKVLNNPELQAQLRQKLAQQAQRLSPQAFMTGFLEVVEDCLQG